MIYIILFFKVYTIVGFRNIRLNVQSGKIEPIKSELNQLKANQTLELVVPNKPNECYFKKPQYMYMVWYINRSNRRN